MKIEKVQGCFNALAKLGTIGDIDFRLSIMAEMRTLKPILEDAGLVLKSFKKGTAEHKAAEDALLEKEVDAVEFKNPIPLRLIKDQLKKDCGAVNSFDLMILIDAGAVQE